MVAGAVKLPHQRKASSCTSCLKACFVNPVNLVPGAVKLPHQRKCVVGCCRGTCVVAVLLQRAVRCCRGPCVVAGPCVIAGPAVSFFF